MHSIKEAATVDDITRSMHKIRATLENKQADHPTSMVEIKCMLKDKPVSILTDLGASLSYISQRIVYLCKLQIFF